MGFEVIFHYREEIERGVYSEEEKTKAVKIGVPADDVPLETVAAKIFAQLARRNILVVDVEIYEFTKKKLNYKETDDGILIKNRKFKFDDGPNVSVQEEPEGEQPSENGNQMDLTKVIELLASNPQLAAILGGGGRQPSQTGASSPLATPPQSPPPHSLPHERIAQIRERPIRHEVFDPPPWLLKEAKRRGLRFTVGQRYPIYKEKIADNPQAGMIYTTTNDAGEKVSLAAIHFNPVPVKLEGRFIEADEPEIRGNGGPDLSWDGVVDGDMPSLR